MDRTSEQGFKKVSFKFADVADSNGFTVSLWKMNPDSTRQRAFERFYYTGDTINVKLPDKKDFLFTVKTSTTYPACKLEAHYHLMTAAALKRHK